MTQHTFYATISQGEYCHRSWLTVPSVSQWKVPFLVFTTNLSSTNANTALTTTTARTASHYCNQLEVTIHHSTSDRHFHTNRRQASREAAKCNGKLKATFSPAAVTWLIRINDIPPCTDTMIPSTHKHMQNEQMPYKMVDFGTSKDKEDSTYSLLWRSSSPLTPLSW